MGIAGSGDDAFFNLLITEKIFVSEQSESINLACYEFICRWFRDWKNFAYYLASTPGNFGISLSSIDKIPEGPI